MGAKSCRVAVLMEPKLAEAMAIKEALSWCITSSLGKVQIEIDTGTVVKAVHGTEQDLFIFGQIISDCQHLLSLSNELSIQYVRRSANQVAHALARASDSLSDSNVWGAEPPNFLISALLRDNYE